MFLRMPDTPLIVLPATLFFLASGGPGLLDNAAGVSAAILCCSWLCYRQKNSTRSPSTVHMAQRFSVCVSPRSIAI
jgi:hypothetical protein